MVFQDPTGSLNPRSTITRDRRRASRSTVHEGPNGETEEELVARALSRAGMRPPSASTCSTRTSCPAGSASGVVIASALVLDPTVIVADEPVSNLDASVRGEIWPC